MLTLLFICCSGIVYLLYRIAPILIERRRISQLLAKVPCSRRTLPLVGDALPAFIDRRFYSKDVSYVFFQSLCGLSAGFKDGIAALWLTVKPFIVLYKAETVQAVLNTTWQINKSSEYNLIEPWLGKGLLTSTGNKWRVRRKMLTPTFHMKILEDFIPTFNEQATVFVSKLDEQAENDWFDIQSLAKRCSLDIICASAMGINLRAQQDGNMDYVNAITTIGDLVISRELKPWLWPDFIYSCTKDGRQFKKALQILHSFTRRVIKTRKEEMIKQQRESTDKTINGNTAVPNTKVRRAFLDMLLTIHLEDNTFTEDDVQEEVDTFMFEGHDTTAAGISWALYLIGLYPKVQRQLHEEMDEIFGADRERPVTREDLKRMTYLERVLKESQRLYPSVPFIFRELEDDLMIKNYKIPKGVATMIFIFLLHRDPDVFPNPEVFDPDRFLHENSVNRNPFAYVPFSAGPRNCIGQKFAMLEEKVVVAHVLRNFKLTSLDHRDKLEVTMELITKERRYIRLHVSRRP